MKQVYTILVNAKAEKDIIEIIEIARQQGVDNKKIDRALICDNIIYIVVED